MAPSCENTLVEFADSPPRVGEGERCESFTIPSNPWGRTDLTYSIANHSGEPVSAEIERIIREAFDVWATALGKDFTFTQTSGEADITIIFYAGEPHHPKNRVRFTPIVDKGQTMLAHAFYPLAENEELKGHIHINMLVPWVDIGQSGTTGSGYKLKSVVIHEIGHVLGLADSEIPGSIMYKDYREWRGKVTEQEIASIHDLYFHGGTMTVPTPYAGRGPGISARLHASRPESTSLGDTESEDTQSEDTQSEDTQSEDTQSEDTQSEDTA
jgi:hypothetical protein